MARVGVTKNKPRATALSRVKDKFAPSPSSSSRAKRSEIPMLPKRSPLPKKSQRDRSM